MARASPMSGTVAGRELPMKPEVSIVIPTLNEVRMIVALVERLRSCFPAVEIIIADGGSGDGTAEAVENLAKIVFSEPGRACQMNAGAKVASGDILWFLHADCWPTGRSLDLISETLQDSSVVGGGFRWGLSGSKWYYGICTHLAHIKNKLRRNLFGDMGIFVRREIFERLDGYAEIPICEEIEFNKRLKRAGKTVILDEVLLSSDRKLLREGPIRAFIKNDIIKCAFALGVSPETLKRYY
jgi:rSAM/selenodomain-associated transferase 2